MPSVEGHHGQLVHWNPRSRAGRRWRGRSTSTRGRNGRDHLRRAGLRQLGGRALILTNAAGGLNPALAPRRLMLSEIHQPTGPCRHSQLPAEANRGSAHGSWRSRRLRQGAWRPGVGVADTLDNRSTRGSTRCSRGRTMRRRRGPPLRLLGAEPLACRPCQRCSWQRRWDFESGVLGDHQPGRARTARRGASHEVLDVATVK